MAVDVGVVVVGAKVPVQSPSGSNRNDVAVECDFGVELKEVDELKTTTFYLILFEDWI